MDNIKVLLVEDNPGDARLIQEMLSSDDKHSYELVHSKRLDDGIKMFIKEKFDIMLLDLGLPDSDGMNTLDIMRYNAPDIPIIVLTGFKDDIFEMGTVGRGAKDYLVKDDLNRKMLVDAIENAIQN
ncbi:MAG: response regulator [Methanobacterium sp. ERen5]|nr:MAG: response regulator [Methanobacterium sp. ERen5]